MISDSIGALRGDGRGRIVLTLAGGWFLVLGMRFVVPALLPQIKTEFAISNTTAGIAVSLIWITYSLMQFPAGLVADRIGERMVLVASLLTAGCAVALYSIAPVFTHFLLLSGAFGLGTGLFGTPRASVITNAFIEHDSTAFGLVLATGLVGSAALPFIASLLVDDLGWRLTLALFAPGFFVMAAATAFWIPTTTGTTFQTLSETGRHVREQTTRLPVFGAVVAAALMVFTYQGLTTFLPLYLITEKGFDQGVAGAIYALFFVCGAVSQPIAGALGDRFGSRSTLVGVTGFGMLPLIAIPFVDSLVAMALVIALLSTRLGMLPVNNAYVIRILPNEVQGSLWGLYRLMIFSTGALGSTVVGGLVDLEWFDQSFFVLAALTALATVCYYVSLPTETKGVIPSRQC